MSTAPRTLEYLATVKHAQGSLPAGFDPATHPIIAKHILGVEPFPIGLAVAETVADLKFRRQSKYLHTLGNRAMTEFLAELGARCGIRTAIDCQLATYAEIDSAALEAAGGGGFAPVPLHEVKP